MKIEEIIEVLNSVTISPNFNIVGVDWDVKHTKIYDDNNIILEKGFSIRTTFMRPDVNSGEIEKGYGRWMYVPENISKDGLVKTAWVCAELIVKHELMEAFLYEEKRIFDPHKSLKDLQYNANEVKFDPEKVIKVDPRMVREDGVVTNEGGAESSEKIFHKQNIQNHTDEISEYLDSILEGEDIKENQRRYEINVSTINHFIGEGIIISNLNGKVLEHLTEENYTLSNLKELVNKYKEDPRDPGMINNIIANFGFTEVSKKETEDNSLGDLFVYTNPTNEATFVLHSENMFVSLVNKNKDVLGTAEGDNYNVEYVEKILKREAK